MNAMTSESWIHGVYLFTTVFGVGVTALDILGVLGHGNHDGHDGGHVGDTADTGGSHDTHSDMDVHAPLLSVLRYLRTFVYFSLGFGPLGLASEAAGAGVLGSLVWAIPGGIVAAFLARIFFQFQQEDVDSSIQEEDLLFERARVIIPISGGNMGKVRIQMGQIVAERYALPEQPDDFFRTDEMVQIVRVTDDCVYVRGAEGSPPL